MCFLPRVNRSPRSIFAAAAATALTLGASFIPMAAESTSAIAAAQPCIGGQRTEQGGNLGWRLSDRWMEYMAKPFVLGKVSGSGWDGKQFNFTPTPQGTSVAGNQGTVKFQGNMKFYGHAGALDMNLSDITAKVHGNTAELQVDYVSNDPSNREAGLMGQKITGQDVSIVKIKLANPTNFDSNSVNLAGTTTLTAEGEKLFGSYKAGTEFAPTTGSLNMGCGSLLPSIPGVGGNTGNYGNTEKPGSENESATPQGRNSGNDPSENDLGHNNSTSTTSNGAAQANGAASAAATGSAGTNAEACSAADSVGVTQSQAQWGVRESFRNYLSSSTANGGWATGGVEENEGIFQFSGNSGAVNVGQKTGTLLYPGTIHFTGHGGTLDMVLSNMEIQFEGNSGRLLVNARSNSTDGKPYDYGRIVLANLESLRQGSGNGGAMNAADSDSSVFDDMATDPAHSTNRGEEGDQFSIKPTAQGGNGSFDDARVSVLILLAALFVIGGAALNQFVRRNPTAA